MMMLIFCAGAKAQKNRTGHKVENPPPEVHFSWTGTCPGDTTCFYNNTLLADTYTWTIADSLNPHTTFTSNDTNLCYVFPGPGTYYVTLAAFNNHYVAVTDTIEIKGITRAAFSWVHCTNQFVNNSMCASSFHWDFGDGASSTLAMPQHIYADTGHYRVTLIASNGSISDTLTKNIFINLLGYPKPQFTYTVSADTVFVHATYYDGLTNYYWNFNDTVHTYGTGRDSVHIYRDTVPTIHYIDLSVRNGCGYYFNEDTVYVDTSLIVIPIDTNTLPGSLTFISNLSIVPNPSINGQVHVYYDSYNDATYIGSVYNTLGEKVFEASYYFQRGVNGFVFSSDGFAQGSYVLILRSENNYTRRKFLVEKH